MFTSFSKLSPEITTLPSPPPLHPPSPPPSSSTPTIKSYPRKQFSKPSPKTALPSLPLPLIKQTRPFIHPTSTHRRCSAALSPPPPPPPPQSDPPPGKDPSGLKGLASSLSRLRDRVQIFLAVLFWLSLFFWASATDKGNNGSGRRGKSRFRR